MGNSKLAVLLRQMHRAIQELQITSISGGEIKRSSRGTQLIIKPGKGGAATTGITLRGEYVPGNTYQEGEMVVIFTGPSTGTYICLQDGTTTAPANGTSWISLPMGSQIGAWT